MLGGLSFFFIFLVIVSGDFIKIQQNDDPISFVPSGFGYQPVQTTQSHIFSSIIKYFISYYYKVEDSDLSQSHVYDLSFFLGATYMIMHWTENLK